MRPSLQYQLLFFPEGGWIGHICSLWPTLQVAVSSFIGLNIQSFPSPWSRTSSLFLRFFSLPVFFSELMNTQSSSHLHLRLIYCSSSLTAFQSLVTPSQCLPFQTSWPLTCPQFWSLKVLIHSRTSYQSSTFPYAHHYGAGNVTLSLEPLSTSLFFTPISSPSNPSRGGEEGNLLFSLRLWVPSISKLRTWELALNCGFSSLSPFF